MLPDHFDEYFHLLREESQPAWWSRAVQVARHLKMTLEAADSGEEIALRIFDGTSPGGFFVVHTPDEGYWQCDCHSREDPCLHVLASAIALKTGRTPDEGAAGEGSPLLIYELVERQGEAFIVRKLEQQNERTLLSSSLKSMFGGVQSGRVQKALPRLVNEDFVLDELFSLAGGVIKPERTEDYLRLLNRVQNLEWQKTTLQINPEPYIFSLELLSEGDGLRIRQYRDPLIVKIFSNRLVIHDGNLRTVAFPDLPPELSACGTSEGVLIRRGNIPQFVAEVVPRLKQVMAIQKGEELLPEIVSVDPRIELSMSQEGDQIAVVARLFYGNPPLAEVINDDFVSLTSQKVPLRKMAVERVLRQELRQRLHLQVGRLVNYAGDDVISFLTSSEGWDRRGLNALTKPPDSLEPEVSFENGRLKINFRDSEGQKKIDFEHAMSLFRDGRSFTGISDEGWFKIPEEWLSSYGQFMERLLDLQGKESLPAACLPALSGYFEQEAISPPEALFRYSRLFSTEADLTGSIADILSGRGVNATLRNYQLDGVKWLLSLQECDAGGILADDMGLGKTLQAISVLNGLTLVVCPTSVLSSWEEQILRFRPALEVFRYHGKDREIPATGSEGVVLTSYSILWRDREVLSGRKWDCVVLDEAQYIKNPDSQTAQAAHQLTADFRLALTGTPLENSIEDLWSQFHFVAPGLLGSRSWFQKFCESNALDKLRLLIKPFILRRTKREVAGELPEKVENTLWCEFSDAEKDLYTARLLAARQTVNASGESMASVLESLLRLRQLCCHPRLAGEQFEGVSCKLEVLVESLIQSRASGHRSLVFSQWTSMLDIVEEALTPHGFSWCRLDGSTINRKEVIDSFQTDSAIDLMLLSLKAGGTGVTLTAADHVYLLDPWWNPAVEQQAADRAHRIGQKETVFVYRLAVRQSVEEQILNLQQRKRELSDFMLESGTGNLTREELKELINL